MFAWVRTEKVIFWMWTTKFTKRRHILGPVQWCAFPTFKIRRLLIKKWFVCSSICVYFFALFYSYHQLNKSSAQFSNTLLHIVTLNKRLCTLYTVQYEMYVNEKKFIEMLWVNVFCIILQYRMNKLGSTTIARNAIDEFCTCMMI